MSDLLFYCRAVLEKYRLYDDDNDDNDDDDKHVKKLQKLKNNS